MKPACEVGDIIRRYGAVFRRKHKLPAHHLRMLGALEQCRTAALGGHKQMCTACGKTRISYNSCRNRHCPKCQNTNREQWLISREADLLPVPYHHVVFTLPHALNPLCRHHPKIIYGILFKAAWETVNGFGWNHKFLGAETGMTAVLHTWGQNLSLHPHLHCIIPGGGLTVSGKWKGALKNGRFLFPVKSMSSVFRAKFMAHLRKWAAKQSHQPDLLTPQVEKACFDNPWVVYSKPAFKGPKGVMEYLGRYSHKVAVSNHRLLDMEAGKITFRWKNYRTGKSSTMQLDATEFLRRFCLHVLPKGFPRIRHYGLLAGRSKSHKLNLARRALGMRPVVIATPRPSWQQIASQRLGFDPNKCPHCGAAMITTETLLPQRGPPKSFASL